MSTEVKFNLLEIIFRALIQPVESHIRASLGFALNPILSIEITQVELITKLLPMISEGL